MDEILLADKFLIYPKNVEVDVTLSSSLITICHSSSSKRKTEEAICIKDVIGIFIVMEVVAVIIYIIILASN